MPDRGGGGGHFLPGQSIGYVIDNGRVNQGFIALNVDNGVAIAPGGDFGDAVAAAGMVGAGHFDAAKAAGDLGDALVIRGHDDFGEGFGLLALGDNVLDERSPGDEGQGFAGEARGRIARGDDANGFHGGRLSHRYPGNRKPNQSGTPGRGSFSTTDGHGWGSWLDAR